ncbi:unnamed protein product [Ambrosiozyma monospora]|uniref:Unnamed protein product n=1 Tax=Ambrosiozyma monospora TaxID=43982 RepID=A0ACB5ST45_AMBMO|nr:unnamed protein product [Ambrosiozyma monospora]
MNTPKNNNNGFGDIFEDPFTGSSFLQHQQQTENETMRPQVLKKTKIQRFKDNVWNADKTWNRAFLITSIISSIMILAFLISFVLLFWFGFKKKGYLPHEMGFGATRRKQETFNGIIKTLNLNCWAFLSVVTVSQVHQIVMAVLVLYVKNIVHLYSYLAFLLFLALFTGFQPRDLNSVVSTLNGLASEIQQTENNMVLGSAANLAYPTSRLLTLKILTAFITIICGVECFIQLFISYYKLMPQFKRTTGEHVGISVSLVKSEFILNIHRSLLLLLLFFFPAMLILVMVMWPIPDKYGGIALMYSVLTLLWIAITDYSTVREYRTLHFIMMVCDLSLLSAPILSTILSTPRGNGELVVSTVVVLNAFIFFLLILQFFASIFVIQNYGKGLKLVHAHEYIWFRKTKATGDLHQTEMQNQETKNFLSYPKEDLEF